MASEFQRRKMAGVFDAMDADANGFLEQADFEALTERWVDIRGWEPGSTDVSGDGRISVEEHRQVVEAWKGTDAGIEAIFPHLDLDGDGHLSRDEFRDLWFQFWAGADENAAGRWMFGPF